MVSLRNNRHSPTLAYHTTFKFVISDSPQLGAQLAVRYTHVDAGRPAHHTLSTNTTVNYMAADVSSEGSGPAVSVLLHRLRSIPPGTAERTDIIRSLLHVAKVEGTDTQEFINVLDEALDSAQMDPDFFRRCLRALRKICGEAGMLPASHMLTEGLTKFSNVPTASGGFADVWRGSYSAILVAIKALRVYRDDDLDMVKRTFCKEVVVWKRLSHPNILPLFGVSTTLFPFCMVSPWMENGNVIEYVHSNSQADRVQLLVDVGMGLQFLHSFEVVHGDLKGANILVDESGHARLADFGMTTILSSLNSLNVSSIVSRRNGTARWMAPELLDPEAFDMPTSLNMGFTTATDIYALSMVVIEIFTGQQPFPQLLNDPSVIFKVMKGGRPARPQPPQGVVVPDPLWELVQLCWQQDRSQRPSISFVLDSLKAIPHGDSTPPSPGVECTTLGPTSTKGSSSTLADDLPGKAETLPEDVSITQGASGPSLALIGNESTLFPSSREDTGTSSDDIRARIFALPRKILHTLSHFLGL